MFKTTFFLFFALYAFLISSYLYQYYFRFSIYGAEAWFRSSRDVSEYIASEKKNFQNVYIANPGDLIIQYAVFGKIAPLLAQKAYVEKAPKQIDNVSFLNGCIDTHDGPFDPKKLPKNTLYIVPSGCYKDKKFVYSHISDIAEKQRFIWDIYINK